MHTKAARARPLPPRKPPPPTPGSLALDALMMIAIVTVLRPLGRRLGWDPRLGPRGWVIFVGIDTVGRFALDGLFRLTERFAREREELSERLRQELRRPPSPEEVAAAWRKAHGLAADHPVPW